MAADRTAPTAIVATVIAHRAAAAFSPVGRISSAAVRPPSAAPAPCRNPTCLRWRPGSARAAPPRDRRGDDQRRLPARSCHVIRIPRDRKASVTIEPEESAVDRTPVRGPGGRERADELGIALRENALAVPHAVLEIEIAKPGPVAPRAELVALPEKISERVGFDHH